MMIELWHNSEVASNNIKRYDEINVKGSVKKKKEKIITQLFLLYLQWFWTKIQ